MKLTEAELGSRQGTSTLAIVFLKAVRKAMKSCRVYLDKPYSRFQYTPSRP